MNDRYEIAAEASLTHDEELAHYETLAIEEEEQRYYDARTEEESDEPWLNGWPEPDLGDDPDGDNDHYPY